MNQYKILDVDVNELPFADFLTSRYSMTVKVNAQKTYDLSEKEKIPFFKKEEKKRRKGPMVP